MRTQQTKKVLSKHCGKQKSNLVPVVFEGFCFFCRFLLVALSRFSSSLSLCFRVTHRGEDFRTQSVSTHGQTGQTRSSLHHADLLPQLSAVFCQPRIVTFVQLTRFALATGSATLGRSVFLGLSDVVSLILESLLLLCFSLLPVNLLLQVVFSLFLRHLQTQFFVFASQKRVKRTSTDNVELKQM